MRGVLKKGLAREFARLPAHLRTPRHWRRAKKDAQRIRRKAGHRFRLVADFAKAVDVECAKHRDATIERAMQRGQRGRAR